jgi:hypothetical protein
MMSRLVWERDDLISAGVYSSQLAGNSSILVQLPHPVCRVVNVNLMSGARRDARLDVSVLFDGDETPPVGGDRSELD